MKKHYLLGLIIFSMAFVVVSCNTQKETNSKYQVVKADKTKKMNADIKPGLPTIDMGIYYPNIQDTAYDRYMNLDALLADFQYAKDIYETVGVQLNLLWVKKFDIDPELLTILADKPAGSPPTEEMAGMNMYKRMRYTKATITERTQNIFESIIETDPNNENTVYILGMKKVTMQFYEKDSLSNWVIIQGKTSGLSFPAYITEDRINKRIRGAITINKVKPKIIAHELGHKAINVSHEHMEVDPAHAIYSDKGLMLYGKGVEILSGKEGRWHKERLLLSPFIYIMDDNGNKIWNPDYQEAGHYFDPIYGDYVVE